MMRSFLLFSFFFFNDTATTEIYTLSLHDALPISNHDRHAFRHFRPRAVQKRRRAGAQSEEEGRRDAEERSEEHTSELQSPDHLVCRLLLEKKKKTNDRHSGAEPHKRGTHTNSHED